MVSKLIKGILAQSKLSISKAISFVENTTDYGNELLSNLNQYTGNAYHLGVTGPPGAGKSSLTNHLITAYRKKKNKVAVIAIDPTSPFSGGSVLGDRIRMNTHQSDPNVFIRSMATRGGQGGLAKTTNEVGKIFDAARFDLVIYETVGVGQIELDVIETTDTTVVVLVPEFGDEIQMLKAGLMEIGDIFAINKSDRPGAYKMMISLKNLLSSRIIDENIWIPKVINTIATQEKGIEDLVDAIDSHIMLNQQDQFRQKK